MCIHAYIGSSRELPLIKWDEGRPGFYVKKLIHKGTIEMLRPILNSEFLYDIGSHMGCSCGFSYGDWSKKSQSENHEARVKDVKDLYDYLKENRAHNDLKLFCTWWEKFPDKYELAEFDLSSINEEEFDFEEDKILIIKKENNHHKIQEA
jgi:hypothetical protein